MLVYKIYIYIHHTSQFCNETIYQLFSQSQNSIRIWHPLASFDWGWHLDRKVFHSKSRWRNIPIKIRRCSDRSADLNCWLTLVGIPSFLRPRAYFHFSSCSISRTPKTNSKPPFLFHPSPTGCFSREGFSRYESMFSNKFPCRLEIVMAPPCCMRHAEAGAFWWFRSRRICGKVQV